MDNLTYAMLGLFYNAKALSKDNVSNVTKLGIEFFEVPPNTIELSFIKLQSFNYIVLTTQVIKLKEYSITKLGKSAYDNEFEKRKFERDKDEYFLEKLKIDLINAKNYLQDYSKNKRMAILALLISSLSLLWLIVKWLLEDKC